MKIKITGSSGYLGNTLTKELTSKGHEVSGINRKLLYGPLEEIQKEIKNTDVIIHLAGAPILQRWTTKNKTAIWESRVKTTQNLVEAINKMPASEMPKKLISASAIGIYKSGFIHNETSNNFDEGFVGKVVQDWEAASSNLPKNVQRIVLRIGLVLGKNAKTITNLIIPFQLGLGAILGNGKQAFPFVHETDVLRAFIWASENRKESGTFNLVAPKNITNKQFTKALAKKLKRPAFLFIPEFMLKLVLGEASVLLTEGAQVEPEHLLQSGFVFQYPTIESALSEIIS